MIWNGKRHNGVQTYIGKQSSDFSGEYIVVYACNGVIHKYGEAHYDAAVGAMAGDTVPNTSSSIHSAILHRDYRPISQKQIPEAVQRKLDRWIED